MGWQQQSKREYLARRQPRYLKASKREKGSLLAEVVAVTGYHRRHARRGRRPGRLPDPALEAEGALRLAAKDRASLLAMSAATIDRGLRLLRLQRAPRNWHGLGTTKPGSLLQHQVPIQTRGIPTGDARRGRTSAPASLRSIWWRIVAPRRKASL